MWSPWYTLHKTFAGLRDAYRYTGNPTALDVEVKFAGWAEGILAGLDDAQMQKMLNTEFGGMNEALVDLYVDSGDRRWLELSHKFDHHAVIDPLSRQQDDSVDCTATLKFPNSSECSRVTWLSATNPTASRPNFWDAVVNHHSFATGGHGKDEYFGPPDRLSEHRRTNG